MLKQRVITALIMLPIFLAGLFATSENGFALFTGAIIAVAAWEWARMGGLNEQLHRCIFAAVVLLGVYLSAPGSAYLLYLVCIGWFAATWLVYRWPAGQPVWQMPAIRLVSGFFLLIAAWNALQFLRISEVTLIPGLNSKWVILYVFVIVWVADIGAYFCGRRWGQKKLAPQVSPGKSVEGALGGLALVALLPWFVAVSSDLSVPQWLGLTLITVLTAMVSIVGDLFESLAKRSVGLKDSSQILPGHGGIMDRIDSITAAAPVFAASLLLAGWLTEKALGTL